MILLSGVREVKGGSGGCVSCINSGIKGGREGVKIGNKRFIEFLGVY